MLILQGEPCTNECLFLTSHAMAQLCGSLSPPSCPSLQVDQQLCCLSSSVEHLPCMHDVVGSVCIYVMGSNPTQGSLSIFTASGVFCIFLSFFPFFLPLPHCSCTCIHYLITCTCVYNRMVLLQMQVYASLLLLPLNCYRPMMVLVQKLSLVAFAVHDGKPSSRQLIRGNGLRHHII